MVKLAVFDIGGTAVKHALYENEQLTQKGTFTTPRTFDELQQHMQQIISAYAQKVDGVAISAPGAVNIEKKQIEGISALPYLHGFPIFDAFEASFALPVTIENDAYCAGLCEMEIGAGKACQHAVFVVLGTGVGGAIFINRTLYKGAHLFGGEFGLTKNGTSTIADYEATVVSAAKRYTQAAEAIDGAELFARAAQGDALAQQFLAKMYDHLGTLVYNIQVAIDPEIIILGGGISAQAELSAQISTRVKKHLAEMNLLEIIPRIEPCQYANDANLLGAALHFSKVN